MGKKTDSKIKDFLKRLKKEYSIKKVILLDIERLNL